MGDAERVDVAVEGIGDAGDMPPDAEGVPHVDGSKPAWDLQLVERAGAEPLASGPDRRCLLRDVPGRDLDVEADDLEDVSTRLTTVGDRSR